MSSRGVLLEAPHVPTGCTAAQRPVTTRLIGARGSSWQPHPLPASRSGPATHARTRVQPSWLPILLHRSPVVMSMPVSGSYTYLWPGGSSSMPAPVSRRPASGRPYASRPCGRAQAHTAARAPALSSAKRTSWHPTIRPTRQPFPAPPLHFLDPSTGSALGSVPGGVLGDAALSPRAPPHPLQALPADAARGLQVAAQLLGQAVQLVVVAHAARGQPPVARKPQRLVLARHGLA
jgi:hypothetical protein